MLAIRLTVFVHLGVHFCSEQIELTCVYGCQYHYALNMFRVFQTVKFWLNRRMSGLVLIVIGLNIIISYQLWKMARSNCPNNGYQLLSREGNHSTSFLLCSWWVLK